MSCRKGRNFRKLVQTSVFFYCSPRDSTGGLGVKMVEYVLGGSPTNKESPLSQLEPRLRALKFDENEKVTTDCHPRVTDLSPFHFALQANEDKDKSGSPFDSNGMKKDDQVNSTNGVVVNGIGDDDKSFK